MRVADGGQPVYHEDILPDGHHEIIFHLKGHGARKNAGQARWCVEPDSFIAGQHLSSYQLELKGDSFLYGIRFYPHTLYTLTGFPAYYVTNTILPLEEERSLKILRHCITDKPDITFKNLEQALMKLVPHNMSHTSGFARIAHSVETIMRCNGNIRIDTLIGQTGLSHKHFDTLFNQFVGIHPKTFCTILKLNYFVRCKNYDPQKTLTQCAYDANFYDQAHLVKVFRSFTGKTPSQYFRSIQHISDQFSEL